MSRLHIFKKKANTKKLRNIKFYFRKLDQYSNIHSREKYIIYFDRVEKYRNLEKQKQIFYFFNY